MKAYTVSDANGDTGFDYIIFAETRAKAIKYALDHCDGAFDSYTWTEMRALRKPKLDKYYRGRPMMDWCDMNDRIAMVKEADFRCSDDVSTTLAECKECPAHEWCGKFESMSDDEEEF